jgi:hypothetical protein
MAVTLSGAANSADKTGIPECDKYFAMVEACAAKMSKEDQAAAQFSVNRLRTMMPIANSAQGRAELEQRCTTSIKQARESDKSGCSGQKG